MKTVNTLSAQNTSVLVAKANKPRSADTYYASIFVSGTFGNGTVSLQGSPDGGTTKITLADANGDAMTFTANGMKNVSLGCANKISEELEIYASIATATSPAISIAVFDNKG